MSERISLLVLRSMVVALVLLPASAYAQATIAGTVKDISGAVLPGVTVEASSPALIEKVRSVTTDGNGQYQIIDLRPGTYALVFTLPSFTTVRREGVEITAAAVATINAELKVGALEETITVSGESPTVDIKSANRGQELSSDVLASVPATRGVNAVVFLVPSVTGGSNQVDISPQMRIFYSHGGRGNEGRVLVDSLSVGAALNGGGVSLYIPDTATAQEMSMSLSGGLGEAETGGSVANIIPKTGGNKFSGTAFGSGAGEWSQGSNIDDRLRGFGLSDPAKVIKAWDGSVAFGGPIKKDRLWFYGIYRDFGEHDGILGMYANKNAGDPSKWNYEKDPNVTARNATARTVTSLRLSTQVSPRNKVGVFFDNQIWCDGSAMTQTASNCRPAGSNWIANGTATMAPESASGSNGTVGALGYGQAFGRVAQATWTSPTTNKLLLEAGLSTFLNRWGYVPPPGAITNQIQVTEQSSLNGMPAGLVYRGLNRTFSNWQSPNVWRASASYVTGSHNMKFGYQGAYHVHDTAEDRNDDRLIYQFNNGVPNRLTMDIGRWDTSDRTMYSALYAQDQWSHERLTLQGALRYDHAWSFSPASHQGWDGPDRFHAVPITFQRTDGVTGFNDITPRVGAAYDLFGDGKTSVKVNLGKYLQSANNQDRYNINNPAQATRFQRTTNRSWNDINQNFVPDCDLMNPLTNGECGPWATPTFGTAVGATINQATLHGWGIRPYDWQFGASIQREVLPRTSLEFGYYRRWFGNFLVTDNRAVGPADFDTFSVVVPTDSRLPGGGGNTLSFVDPKTLATDNYVTFETDYGAARTQYWHGVDLNANVRLANGLVVQAGTSTGRGVTDYCDVAAKLPELFVTAAARLQTSSCHITEQWLTQFRGLATYTVPKLDVQLSTSFQFKPGTLGIGGNDSATNGLSIAANYTAANTAIQQSLGRLPTGGLANGNTIVNLLLPSQLYGDRVNQVDLRIAKVLRFGSRQLLAGIDLYNLLNANPGLTYDQTYSGTGSTWLRPTTILLPRFARFNATFTF
jgi:hypothetical protein